MVITHVNFSKYLRGRFQVLACDAEQFGREIPMFLQNPIYQIAWHCVPEDGSLNLSNYSRVEFGVRCGIPMLTQMKKH
jgi:hypothetical protein